jgi:hypothetical protein
MFTKGETLTVHIAEACNAQSYRRTLFVQSQATGSRIDFDAPLPPGQSRDYLTGMIHYPNLQ